MCRLIPRANKCFPSGGAGGPVAALLALWLCLVATNCGYFSEGIITGDLETDCLAGGLVNPASGIATIIVYRYPPNLHGRARYCDLPRCSAVGINDPEAINEFRLALAAWHGSGPDSPRKLGTIKVILYNGKEMFLHYHMGSNGQVWLKAPGYDGHFGTDVYNPKLGGWLQRYAYSLDNGAESNGVQAP